ncbi:strictosidine synthase [Janibacter sp. Soil728]|uniref:SMP-30/gluconolactonase/LRE family protein n=1 Tax=Janibacter sp. Soil728 TaxID=1736393 RepID=UPI0006FCA3BB|nr:SMP-30/gluconolactonase/LRE family protein [Janibacter sp. Soil728]KRE37869.1 strictosidine synthase [Janibacter sp. Soil728]
MDTASPTKVALTRVPVPGTGAEDVLVGPDGRVWTGTADGAIIVVTPDGRRSERVVETGGRPLGLEWLPDGRLLVCDAVRGLLAVAVDGSGGIEELVTHVDGAAMLFTNNAAVAADGTVWFSDSSRRWGIDDWKSDLVQHTRSGRLLRRDVDGTVTTVLDGVAFANGVALSRDESMVLVAELSLRRIRRVGLIGGRPTAGHVVGEVGGAVEPPQDQVLVPELPGYPDNISRGSDGLIWSAIASPPDPVLGLLQRGPQRLRDLALRLPEALKPSPQRTVRVTAHDDEGRLVHDLSADATQWHMATGVREHDGRVWLGSLVEPAIAYLDVPR